jgi:hypothetical protein
MANNVAVTAGSGTTFKTTDTAGVHTGHVNVDSSALPTGAATETTVAAIQTAVEIIDNAISGTEMQVDVVTSALPTGAATAAKQPALGTAGTASADVISVQGIASMTALVVDGSGVTQPVSGTVTANAGTGTMTVDGSGVTQPVSAASLPLPTGASTAAKQPALGTAGTASTDVISVQGIASMTALVVDGSGVTQPVSGTVTANLSATDNTVLDNIEAGIDELKVLVGEVQATPTANTVLDRLKDIETAVVAATVANTVALEPQGYETVAASQADQALGATGATGDYLAHVMIVPATTSPGAVSIKDGAGSAITIFTGGADSVGSLVPFSVPINAVSGAGAWSITTGASVSAIGVGTFT